MEIEVDCPQEFEIRQPRWLLAVSIITHIAFVGIMAFIIKQKNDGVYSVGQVIAIIMLLLIIFLLFGTLSLISFCRDKFKYSHGEFLCKRVLRKTKKWKIDDVSRIKLVWVRAGVNIVFYDKNDKKIATVTDGIWVWQDGRLRTLLYINKIPIEGNVE